MTPFIAEVLGTFLLILLANGVVANVVLKQTKGHGSGWMVITTGWALAVYTGVLVAGPYSGAHLNPAVTISLAVSGLFDWSLVASYIIAQFMGAMLGTFVVWIMHIDHYKITDDRDMVMATFCTSPAIRNTATNFLSEAIGTFVLVFAVLYIVAPELNIENQSVNFGLGSLGAIPVAFIVWVIGLCLGGPTGYAINPARDLGPRIIHALLPMKEKRDSNWSYSWIPVLGPITGGIIAALLYIVLQ
ncbi:MAG TPA: MIP/aquaporin family protein [Flavobacteriaceae bacterium]|nr:MIP/aquaporin family protein [Flavobacteriaceae bacterium]